MLSTKLENAEYNMLAQDCTHTIFCTHMYLSHLIYLHRTAANINNTVNFRNKKLRNKKMWVGSKKPVSYFLNLRADFDTKHLDVWWCVWVSGGVWRGVCTPQFKNLWVTAANNNLNLPARMRFWAARVRRIDGSITATRVRWWSENVPLLGGLRNFLG